MRTGEPLIGRLMLAAWKCVLSLQLPEAAVAAFPIHKAHSLPSRTPVCVETLHPCWLVSPRANSRQKILLPHVRLCPPLGALGPGQQRLMHRGP